MAKGGSGLKIEFVKFNLTNFSFQINPSFKFGEPVDVNLSFLINAEYKEEKKELESILGVKYYEKDSPFTFNILGRGVFKVNKNPSKTELARLSDINCPAIIFPFIREAIADFTRRAGFSPLLLPVTNFVNLRKTLMKKPTQTRTKKNY